MKEKLNLVDLMHIAYRWLYLLIAIAVLGGAGGYAYNRFMVQPSYTSTGIMFVSSVEAEYMEEMDNMPLSVINASVMQAVNYVEMIEYDSILKDVAAECDSDVSTKQIASMLKSSLVAADVPMIKIAITAPDPYMAFDVATAVLNVASERLPVVAETKGTIIVVENACDAYDSKPSAVSHAVIGFVAGLVLAILVALFIELMDNRIKQTDDLVAKYNLPVIGVVPNIRGSHESKE